MSLRAIPAEESLEALEELLERRWAREDEDEETALDDLIEALVPEEPIGGPSNASELQGDEFLCSSCRLVARRAGLDAERIICVDCAGR